LLQVTQHDIDLAVGAKIQRRIGDIMKAQDPLKLAFVQALILVASFTEKELFAILIIVSINGARQFVGSGFAFTGALFFTSSSACWFPLRGDLDAGCCGGVPAPFGC
jgi:hypothetical protein